METNEKIHLKNQQNVFCFAQNLKLNAVSKKKKKNDLKLNLSIL